MRKRIAQLEASNRSCAVVANNGRMRVSFAQAASPKMGYSGGAETARVNTPTSTTSGLGNVREGTSGMRIVTGSLMGSSRSFAESAKDGKTGLGFTKIVRAKTDWRDGARNV